MFLRSPGSVQLEIRTGYQTHPKEWLPGKQESSIDHTLNNDLTDLRAFISKRLNNSVLAGETINMGWLRKALDEHFNRTEKKEYEYVLNFYEAFLSKAKEEQKPNTVKGYVTFYYTLKKYQEDIAERLLFSELNKDSFDDLYSWMLHKMDYALGNANRQMSRLKTICRAAAASEVEVHGYYLVHKQKKTTPHNSYLTIISEQEIGLIKTFNPTTSYLENTRAWMLIGLHIGQRVSDLLNLTPKDVRETQPGVVMVDITQQKTGTSITIPVVDKITVDILLNKFPRKISSQSFNRFLKELCKACKIDSETTGFLMGDNGRKSLVTGPKYQFISSHDLRRSFCTNHFNAGTPSSKIMAISGHKRESTFFGYVGATQSKDEAAENFLKYLQK
jgi:integrase